MKTQSTKHTPADCGKCGSPRRLLALEFRCECERPAQYLSHQFPIYSAAPELLEACIALLHVYEHVPADQIDQSIDQVTGNLRAADQARAAIAKATGETV